MSDQCPTCGSPVSVRGSDEGTMYYVPERGPMHQASDKAQEAAQRAWYATHSLPSAVNAGCRVQVVEIVEALRDERGASFLHAAADFIERRFGGRQR